MMCRIVGARRRRLHRQLGRLLEGTVSGSADQVEEGFFVLDVEVDGPLRNAERLRDVLHPGVAKPLLDEHGRRDLDEARQPVFGDGRATPVI